MEGADGDLLKARFGALGSGDRVPMLLALQVLVRKHQLAPHLAPVPFDIVRPHAALQMMVDGTHVQIDGFQGLAYFPCQN